MPTTYRFHALEVDQNTDGCVFGTEINDNGTAPGSTMRHVGLIYSCRQDRVNHSQSVGVGLTPNDEEAPEVDQDNSREAYDIGSPNELDIDTIKDSRSRFSKRDKGRWML